MNGPVKAFVSASLPRWSDLIQLSVVPSTHRRILVRSADQCLPFICSYSEAEQRSAAAVCTRPAQLGHTICQRHQIQHLQGVETVSRLARAAEDAQNPWLAIPFCSALAQLSIPQTGAILICIGFLHQDRSKKHADNSTSACKP